jgi:hypothetical protein
MTQNLFFLDLMKTQKNNCIGSCNWIIVKIISLLHNIYTLSQILISLTRWSTHLGKCIFLSLELNHHQKENWNYSSNMDWEESNKPFSFFASPFGNIWDLKSHWWIICFFFINVEFDWYFKEKKIKNFKLWNLAE